ncbi:hypothetical protein C4J81_17995 [Deltaproteobacteria bacterium Smac51]|nr:hypothetical protein C4J81_17995 [Deltaproteobacteria bacterium Smac51]
MSASKRGIFLNYTLIISLPLILMLVASGCQSSSKANATRAHRMQKQEVLSNQKRVDNVLKTAFSQVGNPYRYGGNSPETGFDCSGFVRWVYKQYDVELPRTSGNMIAVGTPVSRDELRPGDLVFFGRKRVSHVGIYTGNNKFIHSPRTGKSIQESHLDYRGRGERYLGARRIINNEGTSAVSENLKQAWVDQSRQQVAVKNAPSSAKNSQARINSKTTATAKKSTVNSKKHKVRSGDTLYDISKKYGVSADALAKANNLNGKKKSQLKLGQTLVVPVKSN